VESKLDKTLRQVQALLATADHPNTPPHEADTARNMAEALMIKYRIQEHDLSAQETSALGPVWRTMQLVRYQGEFTQDYRQLFAATMDHLDIRGVTSYASIDGEGWLVAEVVGYESDLRFLEAMFTAARLAFSHKLEPQYDPALNPQENAYVMRSAGMEGKRIAMAIFGKCDKGDPPKVRAMFKKEAIKRGEDASVLLGQGNSVKLFRQSYATGFVSTFWNRLFQMRTATAGERGGLVLANRKDAIAEAFYDKFPQYRPMPSSTPRISTGHDTCAKCAKAKSGYCREHSYLRPSRARQSERRVNYAGYDRGSAAARTVDLGITSRGLGE
jgi:hypothetical protein